MCRGQALRSSSNPSRTIGVWFSPPLYGKPNFADLFTTRQLVALTTFSALVQEVRDRVLADARKAIQAADDRPIAEGGDGTTAYADALAIYLSLGISKLR